jgi:hypothetical protein
MARAALAATATRPAMKPPPGALWPRSRIQTAAANSNQ